VVPFATATGLRIGELAGLVAGDVDLAAGAVRVVHTAIEVSGRRSVTTPKSRAGIRTAPTIHPALAARLAVHVESRGLGPDDWLFAGPSGSPIRAANWRQRVWLPALDDAGLADPQPTPHSLRHTAIAAWLASGVPAVRAASWAGHSPRVLESTYGHLLDGDHAPVRARLEELFGGEG
jgi:integrase